MTRRPAVALGAALALTLARDVAAQQTATIYGTVRDSATGASIQSALVVANAEHTASADAAGRYTLTRLPAGTVVLSVRRLGYKPAGDTLTIAPGDSIRRDFVLAPRSLSLEPVVVTAGKRSQLLDQVVTSVAIVSDTAIARRAVNTVDEAVDKAPGVQMVNGQVNIRGSSGFVLGIGSRVLLLVDGVPANQGDRGGINWDMLPVQDVERVEIVKGAGSSLYGSAALGGVINLITRDIPTGAHARVRATGGGFANPPDAVWEFRDYTGKQEGLDVTGSYGGEALRGSLTAGGRHSDGYREQDRSDTWEVLGKGEWRGSDATRLHVTGSWASHQYQAPLLWCVRGGCDDRGLAYQPFKIDTMTSAGAYTRSDKGFLAATLEHTASPRGSWLARGSWLRTDFTDRRHPVGDFGVADRFGAELRGEIHGAAGRVAVIGAETGRTTLSSDIFGSHTETAFAAYVEGEQPLGPARFTAGARIDYVETDGGNLSAVVSPRLGAVLPLGALVWRASIGRGFRAPSLAERYPNGSLGPISAIPNPDLGPETAWSGEIGTTAHIARAVHTDAAFFWTEAKGFIEPSVDPTTLQIQFRNVERARLMGLDLAASASPFTSRLNLSIAYTFLYSRDLDSEPSQPLAFRPTHLLTLGADYDRAGFGVGTDFRFMSRYQRVDLYPADPLVSPKVLDLRASLLRGPVTARLLLVNALNYLYNLAPRTLAPVRTLTLAVCWTY
jgi:outer membrane receptor for ferrienterochelin and colicins